MPSYRDLGPYSDLVDAARKRRRPEVPATDPSAQVRQALGFAVPDAPPAEVRVERRWARDGLQGEELTWSAGYGPRTAATLIKPAGATGPLPGVVALHSHDGFTYYGREKVTDGPDGCPPALSEIRRIEYGDRGFADALARAGFAVLAPDVFCWGSRRFPYEQLPEGIRAAATETDPIARHNVAARQFELTLEKYCVLLGTSMAGIVSAEDRMAVEYLHSRPDVREGSIGCAGLSGGGGRAALLQATSARIGAAVVVGMMSTYEGLLDHNVAGHTWMFFPAAWARIGDWPELAAARSPSPLLVQYDRHDHLFTPEGMQDADRRLRELYGGSGGYQGRFYDGDHKFDLAMQEEAFSWLAEQLDQR